MIIKNLYGEEIFDTGVDATNHTSYIFEKLNLKHADFKGLCMHDTEFRSCDLTEASFEGVNMHGVKFTNVQALHCNLTNAHLSFCEIKDSFFKQAFFNRAVMISAKISDSDLRSACFPLALMSDACIVNCDLSHASLETAYLSDAKFKNIKNEFGVINRLPIIINLNELNVIFTLYELGMVTDFAEGSYEDWEKGVPFAYHRFFDEDPMYDNYAAVWRKWSRHILGIAIEHGFYAKKLASSHEIN